MTLAIATANSRKATKWQNKKLTWDRIKELLSETEYTKETVKQYLSYTKDRQDDIKDIGGFVGGYLKSGRRIKGSVEFRQLLTLDVDHADSLDVWDDFVELGYEACMYTTHKHRPEAPRYRIIIPLSEKVDAEQYEAIGRSVADWLGIDNFDDSTYQAERLMYWPSTSKDGEFIYEECAGKWLTPDEALDALHDWTDPTCWPISSRVKEALHKKTGDKVQPPEEKDGVIGAFCRAFNIHDAIAEFIPEYVPGDKPDRYSYVGGSTSNGLILYGDSLAYSWHSTDPAGGKTCNSFDLVRLHKFGDQDTEQKDDITKQPSYKAMVAFASKLTEVKRELLAARNERLADDYAAIEEEALEAAKADDWLDNLETEKNGDPKNTIANVVLILNNDSRLVGRYAFNEFEQREIAIKPLPWDSKNVRIPRALEDSDDAQLRLYLERKYGITGKGQIQDGLTVVVKNNSYHPIKDYLAGLEWDHIKRLDDLFINVLGAPDTAYTRAVTRKMFVAAVARIYRPGIKFEQVCVIVGKQGIGKSYTLQAMGKEWFSDSISDLKGKDALEALQGAWLMELGELAGMRKADVETTKHFVSKREDRYRVAYGKRIAYFPRQVVFFGTTNEEDFLKDVSGNRRFWVISAMESTPFMYAWDYLDNETIDQLWAEALHRYHAGESLMLPASLDKEAKAIQDRHLEKDERQGLVEDYLARMLPRGWDTWELDKRRAWLSDPSNEGTYSRRRVCLQEIWSECLNRAPENFQRADSYFLSRIMKSIKGWHPTGKSERFHIYGPQKAYCN